MNQVSQKKYGAADYFNKNGNIKQCYIFRHNEYNFYLVMCKVGSPYVKLSLKLWIWEEWVKQDFDDTRMSLTPSALLAF